MHRRSFVGSLLSLAAGPVVARTASPPASTVRFGITAVFLYDRPRMLARWQSYLEAAMGARVQFVQRGVYSPAVVVPISPNPTRVTVTVLFASAVPLNTNVASFVI